MSVLTRNPVTVERCVSDVVLVDNALDDSMLDPKLQNENIRTNANIQASGNHEIKTDKAQEVQGTNNEGDENKSEKGRIEELNGKEGR